MQNYTCPGEQVIGSHVDQMKAKVVVGHTILHQTHVLHYMRSVWWCGICGAYCIAARGRKTAPRKLALPCKKKRSYAGEQALKRLKKGRMPNNSAWPPEDEAFAALQVLPRQRSMSKTCLLSNCLMSNGPPAEYDVPAGAADGFEEKPRVNRSDAELVELCVQGHGISTFGVHKVPQIDDDEFDLDPMEFQLLRGAVLKG